MANTSSILPSDLPNPFTPMAWLPPDQAYQKDITTYVLVGMSGVLVWDILTHLGADYIMLTRRPIKLPTMIYYLSRWSTLLHSILSVVFSTAPIAHCAACAKVTCAVYHVAVSSTALLFFLRVRAIFDRNRYITAAFSLMWLAVLGGSLTVVTSLSGAPIGNTKYCTYTNFKPYRSTANVAIGVFDTCVFVAISWRLLSNSQMTVPADNKFSFVGKYLPAFSRALLQDGQNYYMVAMVCNLLVLIMTFVEGIPLLYRTIFLVPSVGLTNIMACRVFRHTKLGQLAQTSILDSILNSGDATFPVFAVRSQRTDTITSSILDSDAHTPNTTETDLPASKYPTEK